MALEARHGAGKTEFSVGLKTGAADFKHILGNVNLARRHLIFGEGSGFVVEQITDVLPKVSTAGRRRTRALRLTILHA